MAYAGLKYKLAMAVCHWSQWQEETFSAPMLAQWMNKTDYNELQEKFKYNKKSVYIKEKMWWYNHMERKGKQS